MSNKNEFQVKPEILYCADVSAYWLWPSSGIAKVCIQIFVKYRTFGIDFQTRRHKQVGNGEWEFGGLAIVKRS